MVARGAALVTGHRRRAVLVFQDSATTVEAQRVARQLLGVAVAVALLRSAHRRLTESEAQAVQGQRSPLQARRLPALTSPVRTHLVVVAARLVTLVQARAVLAAVAVADQQALQALRTLAAVAVARQAMADRDW